MISQIKIRNLKAPNYLMLGAGPTNISEDVLEAFASQPLHPVDQEVFAMLDEIKEMLRYILQTKNRLTLAIQTTGMGGNECILTNLLDPGEKILIAINGFWGERVAKIAEESLNFDVSRIEKPLGESFTFEEFEEALSNVRPRLLFVVHGESSSGVVQKLDGLGDLCHKYDCLLGVDAVASLAAEPLLVDQWKIDAVASASQKAISAPPGFAIISFSDYAVKTMLNKRVKPVFIYDLKSLGSYWKCFDPPHLKYHYTFSACMIFAFHRALKKICDEGIENIWSRHKRINQLFCRRLIESGFGLFVKNPEIRFSGVTSVKISSGIEVAKVLTHLKEAYSINTSAAIQPGLSFLRIGLLGFNCTEENVNLVVQALKDTIKKLEE